MALKKKLTKEEYEKLSDAIKSEYVTDGEGYKLDIEGDEDTGALKRAKDREAQLRRDAEKALKDAQDKLDALSSDDARKKGDIETLEKSWQKKIDDAKVESEAVINKFKTHTQKNLVDNVASSLAHKLTKSPSLLMPHIKSRLVADFDGEEPVTRILGTDGKISAMTLEDLEKEFVANKDFSVIITGSQASGGAGATKQRQTSGSASGSDEKLNLAKATPKQLVEHLKSKREQTEE